MTRILLVDDEKSIRKVLKDIFTDEGYSIDEAVDGFEALNMIKAMDYNAVLCDIKMPKINGIEFLEKAIAIKPEMPVIILSGNDQVDMAVDAVKKGAFDYVSKPPDLNQLLTSVRSAVEKSKGLAAEVALPKTEKPLAIKQKIALDKAPVMIGASAGMVALKTKIEKIAVTNARVLILGENGSGKELVARHIHALSPRSNMPLIEVNCAAIPSELIESELFGHEKGAFTSAIKQRIGKFELAHGGTLFLDEIGDMGLAAQAKVLRALQEGKITRVGGEKEISVDVRVLTATNKNLIEEVEAKNFRMDLYHRLAVIILQVPSLNNRRDDIPLLIDHLMNNIAAEFNIERKEISKEAMDLLIGNNWTGNIRELNNVLARLLLLSEQIIDADNVRDLVLLENQD
jgi:two-component system, NtrC family, nitrogen regulation response regulator NtrX